MDNAVSQIIAGRKTFFIFPDLSLFPENFCEEYFVEGYECYFIDYSKRLSLEDQIEAIVRVFSDVIIFFNIDSMVSGMNWPQFIRYIHEKYGGKVLVGALFCKKSSEEEKKNIEKMYLFDIGIPCGAIQLSYQKRQNFEIIAKTLYANQAMGRRKSVRAVCIDNTCTFSFAQSNGYCSGVVHDISTSHFSCTLQKGQIQVKLYEKVEGVQMNIKGTHFRTNAVLYIERELSDGEMLYVFMFVCADGRNGLDYSSKQIIVPRIYNMMYTNCMALVSTKIKDMRDGREEPLPIL